MHLELNLDLIEVNLIWLELNSNLIKLNSIIGLRFNWIEFKLLKKIGMQVDEKDIENLFVNTVLEKKT
jgi:hypothetical protein